MSISFVVRRPTLQQDDQSFARIPEAPVEDALEKCHVRGFRARAASVAEPNAAMNMMHVAAWRYDNGLECGEHANTAKYLAAEASFFAADQALQTHGEMTLNYIAHIVMGLPRSY